MIGCLAGFCSSRFLKEGLQAQRIILWALVCWPSVAMVTSQNDFSSRRCLKEATMFVWKSFQRRQNCWSSPDIFLGFLKLDETWSCLSETLKPPRSVACCEGVGTRVLLFGGELQPSDRGHEGAGAFSSDTQVFEASTSMKVVGDGKGKTSPPPRGWSASAGWGSGKVVVAGGLAGDDSNPVRMMDVWVAELNL